MKAASPFSLEQGLSHRVCKRIRRISARNHKLVKFAKLAASTGTYVQVLRKYQTTYTNFIPGQREPTYMKAPATKNALRKEPVCKNHQVSHTHLHLLLQKRNPSTKSISAGIKSPTSNLAARFIYFFLIPFLKVLLQSDHGKSSIQSSCPQPPCWRAVFNSPPRWVTSLRTPQPSFILHDLLCIKKVFFFLFPPP